jgi:hypothetical protein
MMYHFIQPSVSLSRVRPKDVLLQATAMTEAKPEMLLCIPRRRRFSTGSSLKGRPNPRRLFAVDVEQLTRSITLKLQIRYVRVGVDC